MRPYIIALSTALAAGFIYLLAHFAQAGGMSILFPSGAIGTAERDLMVHAMLLMLIVVVPVFILIGLVAWRYRAQNTKATYTPDWAHSPMEEFIWWIIPFEIVLVLAALTWGSTHTLAPEQKIASAEAPLTVEVVALPWKWLFIYPEEGVASVNELAIPAGRPVTFKVTADAPMNAFWIPQLGGQIYAMSGMVTELNLVADHPGTFVGKSANYSGEGFAQMTFETHALDDDDFAAWIADAKTSDTALTSEEYARIAQPSSGEPVRYYRSIVMPFTTIVHASMQMTGGDAAIPGMHGMESMDMMHH